MIATTEQPTTPTDEQQQQEAPAADRFRVTDADGAN